MYNFIRQYFYIQYPGLIQLNEAILKIKIVGDKADLIAIEMHKLVGGYQQRCKHMKIARKCFA